MCCGEKLVMFEASKYTQTNFFWGSALDPLGKFTALPKLPSWWVVGLVG